MVEDEVSLGPRPILAPGSGQYKEEPEFLTRGQKLEVELGHTVVLPCKLDKLGK